MHLDFSADTNDHSSCFDRIRHGCELLHSLTNAITQSINAPVQIRRPPHHFFDRMKDYIQASEGLENATNDHVRNFYCGGLVGVNVDSEQMNTDIQGNNYNTLSTYSIS